MYAYSVIFMCRPTPPEGTVAPRDWTDHTVHMFGLQN